MQPSQKILILSASYGGNHRAVAEVVRGYFAAHCAGRVEVRVVDLLDEFAPGLNVLAKFAYQQQEEFFPSLFGTYADLVEHMPLNPVVHELVSGAMARAGSYVDEFDPDAIVATFPTGGGVAGELAARRGCHSSVVLTGFTSFGAWLHPAVDVYFVTSREVREELVVKGVAWDKVLVSGTPIGEGFGEPLDRAACRRELGLSDRFTVLVPSVISAQGDAGELARDVASAGIQLAVVTGRNERARRRFESIAEDSELLRVFGFVDDMPRMVKSADVMIGRAGGLTIFEALASGVPLIMHSTVPGHEIGNVDFVVNQGAGLWSRDEKDAVDKVRFLSSHSDRLKQLSGIAAALGKPAAMQVMCERILAALR